MRIGTLYEATCEITVVAESGNVGGCNSTAAASSVFAAFVLLGCAFVMMKKRGEKKL